MSLSDFESFYEAQWKSRWTTLKAALTSKERQVARRNVFSEVSVSGLTNVPSLPDCFEVGDQLRQNIPRGVEGLLGFYIQDPASVWSAKALQVEAGDTVLDLCAAPGGKTLILIEALAKGGEILANEPSPARRERLMKVIQQYVPRDIRDRVRVTGKDGGLFSKSHPESFDRILVDAPCSGERHLLANPKEFAQWSPARTKRLAQTQYALLSGALEALKPGGTLVYSTCSLSTFENDGVVKKLLKKKSEKFTIDTLPLPPSAERTEHGLFFLPDQEGHGPLYISRLKKTER